LARAIDSVLVQTILPSEIILVDNNSNDGSRLIADKYILEFPLLFTLLTESRQGANFARNTGLSKATGDWIQFLDADDELLPEKLNHQIKIAEDNPTLELIIAANYVKLLNDSNIQINYIKRLKIDLMLALIGGLTGQTSSNLWKRNILDQIGGFNTEHKYIDDPLLVFEFFRQNSPIYFDHQPNVNVHQRLDTESVSRSNEAEIIKAQLSDVYFFFDELRNYLIKHFQENNKYFRELELQKYLVYRNYRFRFGAQLPDFFRQLYIDENIEPHFLTNLKSYYYYLVNSKLRHNGFLKYPDLMLQALLNIGKLLS